MTENLTQKLALSVGQPEISKKSVDLNVPLLQKEISDVSLELMGDSVSAKAMQRLFHEFGAIFLKHFNPEAFKKLQEEKIRAENPLTEEELKAQKLNEIIDEIASEPTSETVEEDNLTNALEQQS